MRPALKWMALGYGAFWLVTATWFVALGIHDKDRTLNDLGGSTLWMPGHALVAQQAPAQSGRADVMGSQAAA